MTVLELSLPEVEPHRVRFSWKESPASGLTRASSFQIEVPDSIDLCQVPTSLWPTLQAMILHSQWNLLRPCRIQWPCAWREGEQAFWSRLLEVEYWTLRSLEYRSRPAASLEWSDGPVPAAPMEKVPDGTQCAIPYSSGKDSLLQAALLTEWDLEPWLVTTTSPMQTGGEHRTARRREVLDQVAVRHPQRHVEVTSDWRSLWDNEFGGKAGYSLAVNELSDTFFYLANAVMVGVSKGATHFFMASEAEVQETTTWQGRIVQHPHFMYSGVTLAALSARLKAWGLEVGSLTSPLPSVRVQDILCRRYPQWFPLQYSCWRAQPGEAMCSRCGQCFRIALTAVKAGENPEKIGIRWNDLLPVMGDWRRLPEVSDALPAATVRVRFSGQVAHLIESVDATAIEASMTTGRLTEEARTIYEALRQRMSQEPAPPAPGFRQLPLSRVDPLVREHLRKVLHEESFPDGDDLAGWARQTVLVDWITEPLGKTDHVVAG